MPARDRPRVALAVVLSGLCVAAGAAELKDLSVRTEDSDNTTQYVVTGQLDVDRPPAAAFAAATDFSALAEAADLIRQSRLIAPGRLSSTLSMCVAFYCKRVRQVADLSLSPPQRLIMRFVPGAGDFKQGRAEWRFKPAGDGQTRIAFDAALVPNFWVPPLIGPWAIRRALAGQIRDTGRAIEQVADAHARSKPKAD